MTVTSGRTIEFISGAVNSQFSSGFFNIITLRISQYVSITYSVEQQYKNENAGVQKSKRLNV
jgi:hypothetical protein